MDLGAMTRRRARAGAVAMLATWLTISSAWTQPRILRPDPLKSRQELFDSGKYALVISQLQEDAIQELPRTDRARAYRLLGQSHERLGAIEKALSVYQLAEGLYPKDINILSDLAGLLHRNQLDERASSYYQRILDIHPNNATARLGLAEIAHTQGSLSSSAEHYEKALKELVSDPLAWRDYAEVLAERRDFKKASAAIHRSLDLAHDVDSLLDLALFDRRQGLLAEAYQWLEEAMRLAPGRMDLRLRHALWLLEDSQFQKSAQVIDRILQESPNNPLARWIRASIELRVGNREVARKDLTVAAQAQVEQPFVAQASAAMLAELQKSR